MLNLRSGRASRAPGQVPYLVDAAVLAIAGLVGFVGAAMRRRWSPRNMVFASAFCASDMLA
jgi:hypothetical protein